MTRQIIKAIPKNASEEMQISLMSYRDEEYIDLRIFFEAGDSGEYRPTRKGLTLEAGFLTELKRGIEKASNKT